MGSDAAAEDVLQQGLLQAWLAVGNADAEIRDARAWLYRIVHNAAISHLRRPRTEPVDEARPVSGGAVHDELERRLAVREALAGLAALPELQREVMLSTAIDGSSHDEVATALGLSHGAVRGLIYRARAALRAAAAALIPSPVVNWAARQELVEAGGRSSSVLDAVAGGGSAGIGGLLLKGGALVISAGALATVAGVDGQHHSHRRTPARASVARTAPGTGSAHIVLGGVASGHARIAPVSLRGASAHGRGGPASQDARGDHGSANSRSGHGAGSGPSRSGEGPRSPSSETSGAGGSGGGPGGSSAGGDGASGQRGGSDGGSGSSSSPLPSGTGSSQPDGSSMDGAGAMSASTSRDGGSDGGASSGSTSVSSDGGSGGSDGGGGASALGPVTLPVGGLSG